MSAPDDRDELIRAQKQVIGVLLEIIKRLQGNSDLDEEYLQIITSGKTSSKEDRLNEILRQRRENSEIAGRLLSQLET